MSTHKAASVDRSTVVLSIRPPFADRILDGTKGVEFRRRPLPPQADTALLWSTGKDGGIVATITLGRQMRMPAHAWMRATRTVRRSTLQPGIDPDALYAYAGGPEAPIWGIGVLGVQRLPRTYPGTDLGFTRAPQSWRYAPPGWQHVLTPASAPGPDQVAEPLVWTEIHSGELLLGGREMTRTRAIHACLTHTRHQVDPDRSTAAQITYRTPAGAVHVYRGTSPDRNAVEHITPYALTSRELR
jgi:hypothetical protein